MGSSPYWYYVAYEDDKNNALNKLRQREFEAGRYNPVIAFPEFPVTDKTESPGKGHKTIADALEEAETDGTRSILDLEQVSDEDDLCIARILNKDELMEYFKTERPTKEIIEKNRDNFLFDIDRGKGFCITVYANEIPAELFFIGYSFD
ncbi:MAG: hypothetical protein LBJ31_07800 [Treponema sp.]|jgi:hypothetical protein|nr:hypothetical protein [Treponema sp.]